LAIIEIRRLGPGDASLLDRVAADVFDHPINKKRLAVYLREPDHILLVAICDGEVVGQARGMIHLHPDAPDELYIDNLGVAPAFQRQGVGTKLMKALLKAGKEQGCEEAWVGTETDNEAARKLYEALGDNGAISVFFTYKL
jgi:ribosomal protein S18 acetylase RimI-like enzyme